MNDNPDILFMKSDKGNTTVVMKRSSYNNKTINFLEDQSQYKVMNFEYTATSEKGLNIIVNI